MMPSQENVPRINLQSILVVSASIPTSLWWLILVSSSDISKLILDGVWSISMIIPMNFIHLIILAGFGWILIFPTGIIGYSITLFVSKKTDIFDWVWIATSITGYVVIVSDPGEEIIVRLGFFSIQQLFITLVFLFNFSYRYSVERRIPHPILAKIALMISLTVSTYLTSLGFLILSSA